MTMHIETGHPGTHDVKPLAETRVRFVNDDGLTMFEVSAGEDGRSIEVRAVETAMVDGVVYAALIDVRPIVSNHIVIRMRPYGDI